MTNNKNVTGAVMVVGGGIAGMQASLDLANARGISCRTCMSIAIQFALGTSSHGAAHAGPHGCYDRCCWHSRSRVSSAADAAA